MGVPGRLTKGVEPEAVKAARPVLNGGDAETCGNVTRFVPTQLRFRQQVSAGVSVLLESQAFFTRTHLG
jgi:hypothetical protein